MLPARALAAVSVVLLSCASCTPQHRQAKPAQRDASGGSAGAAAGPPSDRAAAPAAAAGSAPALRTEPAQSPSPSLPPGALVELVPSAADLPPGFVVQEGAGPTDVTAVAAFAADPDAAAAALRSGGFKDGYSAEYGDQQDGAFLSVRVLRFDSAAGAKADFAREVAQAAAAAEPLPISPLGEESAAFREKVPEGDVAEIVSVRFRVRELVWLVETGGQETADSAMAHDVAAKLVRRTA